MVETNDFGAFFRRTRKGLGLTLRTFCHQNGFDPGNVSRIERGVALPPKKDEVLNKYAKALKLNPGSDGYNQFFDLAAKETGRISAGLLENQATAEKLPKLLRSLRGGPGHRNWVTARHLNQWADTLAARSLLPQFLRRLTHATGKSISYRSFPSGEQTQRHGFDGIVETVEQDTFVPLGKSVWEMGVDQKPAKKAEDDFEKRLKQKHAFDVKDTTYVFVTPRSWPGKQKWVDAKNMLGVWKEVRVYDSANLEEWLELAPAVDIWLARLLEIRPDGLADMDEYWENLSGVTDPPLTPSVFMASRQQTASELEKWLAGPPSVIVLETRSPSEAVDFVASVVRKAAASEIITSRTVIVNEKNAWRSICRSDSKLVLVAHPNLNLDEELVAEAVRKGHHVILSVRQSITNRIHTLKLPRVYRHHLDEALRGTGMQRDKAAEYAEKAGGSLTVLKRLIAKVRGTELPLWSSGGNAQTLVPVLLAGAWNDQIEGDKAVLAKLAGRPYEVVAEVAGRWLDANDPPVRRVLSTWSLVSRDDSWMLLSHAVTSVNLEVFEQVALDVLGENDPSFDLPPDDRWKANIKGKVPRCSQALRTGIAETLALLGARPGEIHGAADVVRNVVRRLLEPKDWKRWASLSNHLPHLAEAAPDAFMTAVENDLRLKNPVLMKLFEQQGTSPIFSSNPHAGLLWALEVLAWNRMELARVSYALARIDELLAGRKPGNNPMSSLTGIYLPWYPQTMVPVDERVKILREICCRHPESGWQLLLKLLPERLGHSNFIHRPAFRDWALTWKEGVSTADYNRQVIAISDLAVEYAGTAVARLKELIDHFENLEASAGDKLCQRLEAIDVSRVSDVDRRELSDSLREKIGDHRGFQDTDWALPKSVLDRLEQVRRHLDLDDPVQRNAWLFNPYWEVMAPGVLDAEGEIAELRQKAISEIIEHCGWPGLIALAKIVKAPAELGTAVGKKSITGVDAYVLPSLLEKEEEKLRDFARGYIWGRFQVKDWAWVESLNATLWSPTAFADFALQLPFKQQTWAFIAKNGKEAERQYWQKTSRPVPDPKPEEVSVAVGKLLEYGRPSHACFIIRLALHNNCPVELTLVVKVLEAAAKGHIAEPEMQALGYRRHEVVELIQLLQKDSKEPAPVIGTETLARLEWAYLAFLDGHPAKPEILYTILETDPKFFVELLMAIFRAKNEDPQENKAPTAEEQARARNAYQLLHSWKRLPGTREDNEIDEDILFDWTHRARLMAEEHGRLEICDSQFGSVLAHSPTEQSDGCWPCIAVRDLIEELASAELENGFEIGIYNKRGGVWKSMHEGGKKERALSKSYREWAEGCKIEWPRTAAALRRVAEGYEQDASREDAEVEMRL